jgi:hypothetical protein
MIFTKEGNKKISEEVEKLKEEKIKMNVYHATSVPKNISPYTIETLKPISISPDYELPEDIELPDDLADGNKVKEPQRAK